MSKIEQLVYKICADTAQPDTEDWASISALWDTIKDSHSAREVIDAAFKRLDTKKPNVQLVALTLLDSCVKNCSAFPSEMSSCLNRLSDYLQTRAMTDLKVCDKIKELISNWDSDFGSTYPNFHHKYTSLKKEGYEFLPKKAQSSSSKSVTFAPAPLPRTSSSNHNSSSNSGASTSQEDNDMALAIALSLKEQQQKQQQKQPSSHQSPKKVPIQARARALFTFEAKHNDELGFSEGDVISLLNMDDPNWWKGELRGKEGLIPVKYVELITDAQHQQSSASSSSSSSAPVITTVVVPTTTTAAAAPPAEPQLISKESLQELMHLLANADPAGENLIENEKIRALLEECHQSRSIISTKLGAISKTNDELGSLTERFCKAFLLYDQLSKAPVVKPSNPSSQPLPQLQQQQQPVPVPIAVPGSQQSMPQSYPNNFINPANQLPPPPQQQQQPGFAFPLNTNSFVNSYPLQSQQQPQQPQHPQPQQPPQHQPQQQPQQFPNGFNHQQQQQPQQQQMFSSPQGFASPQQFHPPTSMPPQQNQFGYQPVGQQQQGMMSARHI